jgi:hypothetical protein
MRIEKAMPFQVLIKDYKSDSIYRIFFAFPEERQKVSTLFEGTTGSTGADYLRFKKKWHKTQCKLKIIQKALRLMPYYKILL